MSASESLARLGQYVQALVMEVIFVLGGHSDVASSAATSRVSGKDSKKSKPRKPRRVASEGFVDLGVSPDEVKPSLLLTYTTATPASGLLIKRLQCVAERPNWLPEHPLVCRLMAQFPHVFTPKLKKHAVYVSRFSQALSVYLDL